MTATIPMELLEAYVALHREVQECMEPEDDDGCTAHCFPTDSEVTRIAAACLAINKLTKTEEVK